MLANPLEFKTQPKPSALEGGVVVWFYALKPAHLGREQRFCDFDGDNSTDWLDKKTLYSSIALVGLGHVHRLSAAY